VTVLIILAGLAVSHFATGFRRWRSFEWPIRCIDRGRWALPGGAWRATGVVLAVSLLGSGLLIWLFSAALGGFGWALLALAAIVYTLGPRDLDEDVERLLDRGSAATAEAANDAALAFELSPNATAPQAASAVVRAALSRWFGVLFWFVVLGVAGAVLYRLTDVALDAVDLDDEELDRLLRLRGVLDWPVVILLLVSCGLCGDLDRVSEAWREWRSRAGSAGSAPALVDRLGLAIAGDEPDFDSGLRSGHQMVWRMLILWLSVLSLALLAGWLV
jgi:AmpE protein